MIILDTNIVIYLSKDLLDAKDIFSNKEASYGISIITYMEVLGYDFKDKSEEIFIKKLMSTLKVVEVNSKIAQKTIEIKKNRKIKLPDAIICATALILNAKLITEDKRLKSIFEESGGLGAGSL